MPSHGVAAHPPLRFHRPERSGITFYADYHAPSPSAHPTPPIVRTIKALCTLECQCLL
jgi:hypothetical protein